MPANPPGPFVFPREYHFPPFFTRQTNLTTRHAQLTKWAALVLAYCRHHRLFKLSPSAALTASSSVAASMAGAEEGAAGTSSAATTMAAELFQNAALNRRLAPADAREVLEFMRRDGRAEPVAASPNSDMFWVYWRTPEEWAALVDAWIDGTGQKGSVMTVYELTQGDGASRTEFHGIDQDLLLKALQILVKRGKAQIFGQEDSQGVKFF